MHLKASDSDGSDRPLPTQSKRRINRAIVDSDSDSDVIEEIKPINDRNRPKQMPGGFPDPSSSRNQVNPSNRAGDQVSARQSSPMNMPFVYFFCVIDHF
jgi:hypothetical protein